MKNKILSIKDNLIILTHGEPDRPNIGLIKGKNGLLLVDAESSEKHAHLIKKMLGKKDKNLDQYVILTH